ncbi:hypothetical protein [Methylobacterium trifolii]|nr:hypothetical protein [Methylobacterium trifolii]
MSPGVRGRRRRTSETDDLTRNVIEPPAPPARRIPGTVRRRLSGMELLLDGPGMQSRLARLPTFDPEAYLRLNPDLPIAAVEAVAHFSGTGLRENRPFCTPQSVVAALRRLPPGAPPAETPVAAAELAALVGRFLGEAVGLYVHSHSPPKIRLAAEMMAGALMAFGIDARLRDETADPESRLDHCLFFAPHAFFFLDGGARWLDGDILAAAVLCPTEPVHSTPQARTLPLLLAARALVDGNAQNCALYAACGIPHAEFLGIPCGADLMRADLADEPLAASLQGEVLASGDGPVAWGDRPIDLCFFGTHSTTRDEVFVHGAAALSRLGCFTPYPERVREPRLRRSMGARRIALENRVARNSRILLAIDAEEIGSVAGYGMGVLGFGNGALVLSRPLHAHPVFKPGEHFLEESSRRIGNLAEWLATTTSGADLAGRITGQAHEAFTGARYRYRAVHDVLCLLDGTRPAAG